MRRGSGLISRKPGSVRAAIFAGELYSVTHGEGGAFRQQLAYYCAPTCTNRELRGQK
jgi:hypothetical protein